MSTAPKESAYPLVSYSHQKSIEISFSYLKHMITKDFSPNQGINWRTRFRIGSPLNGELFDVDGPQRRIDWDGRTLQQLQLLAGIVVLSREQPSRMCPNKTTQRTKRSLVENPAAQHCLSNDLLFLRRVWLINNWAPRCSIIIIASEDTIGQTQLQIHN